jgi:hypothetical protein
LWCYNKLDFLLSESPDKCKTQDELELQSYQLDKSDLEKPHSTKYPRLSVIAKRVLAVPATFVPSEKIFSSAGLIVTQLRNRLSSEVVDQIIL